MFNVAVICTVVAVGVGMSILWHLPAAVIIAIAVISFCFTVIYLIADSFQP